MSTNPGISVVLYGEAGCGKSTNAERIAKALNLTRIVEHDDFYQGKHDRKLAAGLPSFGVLLITTSPDKVIAQFPRLSYDHAMTAVKIFESNKGEAA